MQAQSTCTVHPDAFNSSSLAGCPRMRRSRASLSRCHFFISLFTARVLSHQYPLTGRENKSCKRCPTYNGLIIPMLQQIRTIQDMVTFIEMLANEIGDYNPFAEFVNFTNPATGERIYTDEEAALRKRLLDECFEICGQQCNNFINLFIVVLQDARNSIARLQSQLTTIHNRTRADYFSDCKTIIEVKTQYLQLADECNFYRGGDAVTIKKITEEYTKACEPIIMHNATSEDDMLRQFELSEWYLEIIGVVLILTGVKVEIADSYLWVSCSVYQSEKILRETGLKYSPTKQAWYYPM